MKKFKIGLQLYSIREDVEEDIMTVLSLRDFSARVRKK